MGQKGDAIDDAGVFAGDGIGDGEAVLFIPFAEMVVAAAFAGGDFIPAVAATVHHEIDAATTSLWAAR